MEIERKFLVKARPPEWKTAPKSLIRQGYFSVSDQDVEIRLRKKDSKGFITIKAGSGCERLEEEIPLARKSFETLWPLVRVASIVKKRCRIRHAGRVIELDIYEGRHRGLMIAEIEFRSVREAKAFGPPSWLGREITGNRRYANESLARQRAHKLQNGKAWRSNSKKRNPSARR